MLRTATIIFDNVFCYNATKMYVPYSVGSGAKINHPDPKYRFYGSADPDPNEIFTDPFRGCRFRGPLDKVSTPGTYNEGVAESFPNDGDDKVDLLVPQHGQVGVRVVLYHPA
jgi:hypothetical protein